MADTSPSPESEPQTLWRVCFVATLAGVICCFQLGKVPPAMDILRSSLGLDMVFGGYIASAFILSAAILGLPAGAFANRFGSVQTLVLAMAITGLGSLFGAVAESGSQLLISRIIESFGFVLMAVAAPALILASARVQDRALAIGVWGVYLPLGVAVAMVIAPWFLGDGSFRGFWYFNGAACLLCAVLVHLVLSPIPVLKTLQRANVWDGTAYLKTPAPWLFVLSFAVYSGQYHAVITWLPTLLTERFGFSIGAASNASAGVALMSALGSLFSGFLNHRGLSRSLILAGSFVGLMLGAWVVFASQAGAAILLFAGALFSLSGGSIAGLCIAGAPSKAQNPSQSTLANGLLVQGSNLGGAAGPPALAAVVAASGGWSSAWWILCVLSGSGLVLAALIFLFVEKPETQSLP